MDIVEKKDHVNESENSLSLGQWQSYLQSVMLACQSHR